MALKARLILNWKCGRTCRLCCNDYQTIMAGRKMITTLDMFANYDEVMLTGGDPLLIRKEDLLSVIRRLRELNVRRIYLYTTWWNKKADEVVPLIDGVHFSLHPDAGQRELKLLRRVEDAATKNPGKSFRLFVDSAIQMPSITVSVWSRVERKEFMTEAQLLDLQPGGVPQGEFLYVFLPTAMDPNPPIRDLANVK